MYKRRQWNFVVLLIFVLSINIHALDQNCDLKIAVEKEEYEFLEPIMVRFELKNVGMEEVNILVDLGKCLIIKDSNNNLKRSRISTIGGQLGVPLSANKDTVFFENLFEKYSNTLKDEKYSWIIRGLIPGKYSIQCVWEINKTNIVYSNQLDVIVSEPGEKDEIGLSVYKKLIEGNIVKDLDELVKISNDYLSQYPNSIYKYSILEWKCIVLYTINLPKYMEEWFDNVKEIVGMYPNNPKNYFYLRALFKRYKQENRIDEFKKFLDKYNKSIDQLNTKITTNNRLFKDLKN